MHCLTSKSFISYRYIYVAILFSAITLNSRNRYEIIWVCEILPSINNLVLVCVCLKSIRNALNMLK